MINQTKNKALQSRSQAFARLQAHYQSLSNANVKIQDLFQDNPKRFEQFSLKQNDFLLDYSKQYVTEETLNLLLELAESLQLKEKIEALFSGEKINLSEDRAVLHTALRDFSSAPLTLDGQDIKSNIRNTLQNMFSFAENIQNSKKQGVTNLKFTDVLCLGIGGSELGPALVCEALAAYQTSNLKIHFVSNIFGPTLVNLLDSLNPATTLCIISSKTFTTPETLCNAATVKAWYENAFSALQVNLQNTYDHFIAVTANRASAEAFGILPEQIFEFWEWVGGRYSIWSAVGLPVLLKIGTDHFQAFLRGARAMDSHFYTAPLASNMPVILGLLGVWNNTILQAATHAILPYDDRLQKFPAYLQQLEMESNGKGVNAMGEPLAYTSAPVVWGGLGCNGQHAYMQLLHQGTQVVPVDFLISARCENALSEQHKLLLASCFSQSKALMDGQLVGGYKLCPGNRPSSTLIYSELTPHNLGALIALYEHKVFVQGIIWGINSFDQWGVELGKVLAKQILPLLEDNEMLDKAMKNKTNNAEKNMDSSTVGLLQYARKFQ